MTIGNSIQDKVNKDKTRTFFLSILFIVTSIGGVLYYLFSDSPTAKGFKLLVLITVFAMLFVYYLLSCFYNGED
jgi:RsiW-degrading membrane proteinase PrsW (M82 family)